MYYCKGKGNRLHLIELSKINNYNIIRKKQKPIKLSQFSKRDQAKILKAPKQFKYVPTPVGPRAEENKIIKKTKEVKPKEVKPKKREKTYEERLNAYDTGMSGEYGLKAGKRANILATHPDKGGTNEAFRAVHSAYAGLSANPTEEEIKKAEASLSPLNLPLWKPYVMSEEETQKMLAARTPRQVAFEDALEKWLEEHYQEEIARAEELGIIGSELPGLEKVYESESFKPVLKLMPRKPKSVQEQIERLKQDIGRVIARRGPRGPYKPKTVKTDAEKQAEEALKEIKLALTPRVEEPTEAELRQLEELKALQKANKEREKALENLIVTPPKAIELTPRQLAAESKRRVKAEKAETKKASKFSGKPNYAAASLQLTPRGSIEVPLDEQAKNFKEFEEQLKLNKLPSIKETPKTKSEIMVVINGKQFPYNSVEAIEERSRKKAEKEAERLRLEKEKQLRLEREKQTQAEESEEEPALSNLQKKLTAHKAKKEEERLAKEAKAKEAKEARRLEREAEKLRIEEARQKQIRRNERAAILAREEEEKERIIRMKQQVEETAELARREKANRELRALPSDELGRTGNYARQQGAEQPRSLFRSPRELYEEPSTPGSNWGPPSPREWDEEEQFGVRGNGINFKHIKWGTLTEQYNNYNDQFHHKIPTLEAFAHVVITHPKMFDDNLVKKAHFYVNVLEHHKNRK